MKPPYERLNHRLEQQRNSTRPLRTCTHGVLLPSEEDDPEVSQLVAVAQRIQNAPQLQVDAHFTDVLESRLLQHYLRQHQMHRKWSLLRSLRAHPVLGVLAGLCLCILLVSTMVLTLASQVANPSNPLYEVKQWEQHVQYALTASPVDRAALDLQFSADCLGDLSTLVEPQSDNAYLQMLANFDQQMAITANAINSLPESMQRTELLSRMSLFRSDARDVLHRFLAYLSISARIATTASLGSLGEVVPHLTEARLIMPATSSGVMHISISGSGIQSGAQLLADGKTVQASGSAGNGQFTFTPREVGSWTARSVGILNPDGTAAQTSNLSIKKPGANPRDTNGTLGNGRGK